MSVSSHLFELIKSLTKNDKRYFQMHSEFQGGYKIYMELFDMMDKQQVYDEEFIREQLGIDHLHVVKGYLYNQILKSLQSSCTKDQINIAQQINTLLSETLLLEKRGLYHHARKHLKKAKKLAIKYSKLHLLVPIIRKEISYLFFLDKKKIHQQFKILHQESQENNRNLMIESKIKDLYYQITILERTKMYSQQQIKTLSDTWEAFEQEYKIDQIDSFYIQFLKECIRSIFARFRLDKQARLKHYQKAIAVWESHRWMIKEESHSYKIHLANLLNCYFAVRQWDVFPELIQKFKSIPSRNFNEEAESFQSYAFYELLYFLNTRKLEHAVSALAEITKGIKTYQSKINKSRELSFYYNISILYFLLNDFKEAHNWLKKILDQQKNDHRKDIQRFAMILELFYHYELRQFELVQNLWGTVKRRLQSWAPLSNFEAIVMNSLKDILYSAQEKEKLSLMQQMQQDLQGLSGQKSELGMEEIMLWTEKHLS